MRLDLANLAANICPDGPSTRRVWDAQYICTWFSRAARGVLRSRAVDGVAHAGRLSVFCTCFRVYHSVVLTGQQRNMISSSAWGTKWYITLFVNTVPFSTQLRLWDALWLDGRDVIVATAIAIVWSFKGEYHITKGLKLIDQTSWPIQAQHSNPSCRSCRVILFQRTKTRCFGGLNDYCINLG